ncbi:MAG: hypothetical protein ACFE9Q_01995 [Candidatus Hodarchaeota archaeon]
MASKNSDNSQERIKKATEALQKFWWFSFFLVIAPLVVAIGTFLILNFARAGFLIALSLSVVSFMFALLFFYKAFDKYRNKPFFLNKRNNLSARIHVLFLISILSFVSTPIFIIISGFGSFYHLPVISYSVLYSIVYYYYYFQPIDFFDLSKEEFKHADSFNLIAKQPYNFFVGINHFIHIIFLSFTAYTNLSWLFALTTNLIFYFITLTRTKRHVKEINESIEKKTPILKDLTVFKKKFVVSIVGLIFFLLIQMPFIIIIIFSLSGVQYSSLDLINNSFLTIIFILFYFKSSFYINYYYGSKVDLYDKPEKLEEFDGSAPPLSAKYQRYNSYMSIILILLITLFSFLIQIPWLMVIILPFIYLLLHYEQKYNLCSKKYNKSVVLLNSIALLIYISFGIILPTIRTVLLHFLVFCISFYIVLQAFVKFEYFSKENVLIVQNLLAVASFTLLVYSFFPIIIVEYISYTLDPVVSNILLHTLIISVVFLISQYIMGVRYFYSKSPKLFRIIVLINSILVELFVFTLILFRNYFLIELIPFLQGILISSVLFPIFFILFLYLNYSLHVFPLKYFLKLCYFTLWIFMVNFFALLLILSLTTNYYILIPIDCIITSILYYFISKFGFQQERIDESKFKKRVKINSYLLTIELFSLFNLLFFSAFQALSLVENIIYSTYLSLALVCGLINLFSKREIFSEDLYIKINTFILLYTSIIAFYYFLLLTIDILFVFIIPLMVSSIIFYIPILYLRKKKLYPKFISKTININAIVLSTTISLIPTITGLQLYFLGIYFDLIFLVLTVINSTLYILLVIFTIVYAVLKQPNSVQKREKRIQKLQILILFCISGTTMFYYPYFLLIKFTYYSIVLPLSFTSLFLYIPLFISYKHKIFNVEHIKRAIIFNTIILTGLITSIPLLIGLNLLWLGLVVDFNIFVLNILNSSIYIFYIFLLILINLSKKVSIKDKFVLFLNRLKIVILFGVSITTVFFYPFFLLINSLYYIILPSIFTSCFVYILLYYSYRKVIFNVEHLKTAIVLNTMILTGFFTSIPILIGLNIFWLGLVVDFNIFILNIVNSSIYIFYVFLLILINISRKLNIKEKYLLDLNRLKIILLFCISFTTIFCYPFFLLINTFHGIFISIILLLFSWFFLFYYSYKQEYFNLQFVKKITIYNFITFSCLIISLPTIIGLELTRIELSVSIELIITITLLLLFSFLKISEEVSVKIKLKEKYIKQFKLAGLFSWFLFTLFISYYIASTFIVELVFTPLTSLILACSFFNFFILSIYTVSLISKNFPEYSNVKYFQDLIIYGIIVSISSIFTFLGLSSGLFSFLIWWPPLLNMSFLIGFFLAVFLIFLNVLDKQFQLSQTKTISKLASWLTIKIIICLSIISLAEFLGFLYSIFNNIFLFSLAFTFLTPISLYILENLRFISSEKQILLKKITLTVFILSILILHVEYLYNLINLIPIFYFNLFVEITAFAVNLLLFFYYYSLRFNKKIEAKSVFELYKVYFTSFFLFLSLLYFGSVLSIFLILITYSLILSRRSILPGFRFLSYFLLSYYTFLEIMVILSSYNIIVVLDIALAGLYVIIYLLSINGILIFSILLHIKKNNNLEKFTLYSLISLLSFVSLMIYTNIWLLYNVTISLFLLFLFIGIFFYRQKDERYKWFIKPCVLLFVFDLISFLSYSWLFNNLNFAIYSPILTLTLTITITGLVFILLYNSSPARFRKRSFYIVLSSVIVSFPTFLYFIIIASLGMPIFSLVPLIFAIDIGVLLFYVSIGIYQWKISWAIWKSGWYAWNILPFVNFFIIYQSLTGIDVYTNSLRFGAFSASGSFILSIIICSLFFFPVVYTKIKKHFSRIVFIIWGESLFLLYWASFNLFKTDSPLDLLLRNISFILFSVVLLIPLLMAFKYWKIVSILWIFPLTIINATFLFFYLFSIDILLEMTVAIDILVIGLFLIVYSFFPTIRSIGVILITAYFITLLGIFLTVYFILYLILLNPIFSLNISFLVVGFSLFSSKYVEVPKRLIDLCLSWILIINLSWLTFNTFNLLPGLLIFAISLAITVFGCSFFIINRYKMKISINRIFPFLTVAFGTSSSITSLSYIIFNTTPGILISIFSSVFIIFLYFTFVEYRYVLWFIIPIPITTPILEGMLEFEVIKPFWLLTWAILYLLSFQIIFNLFKNAVKKESQEIKRRKKNSLFKLYQDMNQVRWLNLTCFFLNSIFFSLFIAIIIPQLLPYLVFSHILFVYQISDFLIIWPILFLICLKYVEKSKLNLKVKDFKRFFSKISSILYLVIPIGVGINLMLYMVLTNTNPIISIYILLLGVSGLVFIETSFIDRTILHFLSDITQNLFILWSWIALSNSFSLFLFLFHSDLFLLVLMISLLGLISVQFLSYFDVPKKIISKSRLTLIYNAFIWSSLYVASIISDGLILIFEELAGIPQYLLLYQNSSIILYILSVIFVRIERNLKNRIEFILFIVFQGLLLINLFYIFIIYGILNFFSINLVIFIEVCLSFISIYYFNTIIAERKYPNFKPKMHELLILILYCEISIMSYALLYAVIGIYQNLITALSILFILTIIEIYSIKKIKTGYARLIHTISFLAISVIVFLLLYSYISQYPFFLGLGIFIFMIMQFYTNYSLFKSLEEIFPKTQATFKKDQVIIQQLIGTAFYGTICIFLAQILSLYRVELQLILLILSLIIHGLMFVDKFLFKFLGKIANYVQVISWLSIMTFTSTFLIWLYSFYFIAFFYVVIPIIVIILLLEFAYLIKLLAFWRFTATNKEKIKFILVLISYLNFITWPLYFASFTLYFASFKLLYILNLTLVSFIIMFLITLIDKVIKEELRKSLRSFSILMIGGLLSIDSFLLLNSVPNFDIFLNLTISSLIIHVLMLLDSYVLKFIGKTTNSIKILSWILIMIFTSWFFSVFCLSISYALIPFIMIMLIIEFTYLFKLLASWKFVASNKKKIKHYLVISTYLNFITWPLYFASLDPFHVLNLVLASFSIMFFLSLIDTVINEKLRKSLRSYSFLIIGGLLSIDLFLTFYFILNLIFLGLSISALVFVIFLGIVIKPFKGHSARALIFWIVIFLLLSSIIYHISLSFVAAGIFFAFTVLIYPFVFLLEELRELVNKIIGAFTRFLNHLKILIKNIFIRLLVFLKKHFKFIWIIICAIIASFSGILFSDLILGLLNPYHSILLVFPVFGILFSLKPSEKTEDVDIMFRRRMLRLVTSWGSIIIILFSFMFVLNVEAYWYALATWISIWILGAILLPYIIFKEKRENISIKWRFYTLIILISMLILFGIIVGIQIYMNI